MRRQEYNSVVKIMYEQEKRTKESERYTGAWKNCTGRFQMRLNEQARVVEKLEEANTRLTELVELTKLREKNTQIKMDDVLAKNE